MSKFDNVEPRPADKSRRGDNTIFVLLFAVLGTLGFLLILALTGCSGADPVLVKAAPTTASAAPSQPDAKHVVEIIVTGAPATVTYGAGEQIASHRVPVHKTFITDDHTSYDANVALHNTGTVHCTIKVNGKVVAQKSVSGAGGFMSCVVYRDAHSGKWTSMYS